MQRWSWPPIAEGRGTTALAPVESLATGATPQSWPHARLLLLLHTHPLRTLRAQRCDVVDLVQPGNSLVTAFLAQNGFFIRPVAH